MRKLKKVRTSGRTRKVGAVVLGIIRRRKRTDRYTQWISKRKEIDTVKR